VLQAGALEEALRAARALDMEQVGRKVISVDEVALGAAPLRPRLLPTTGVDTQAAADAALSIETYLRPIASRTRVALASAIPRMQAGELIVIRDAFEPDFAERMYRSLDRCTTWRPYEATRRIFRIIITISTTRRSIRRTSPGAPRYSPRRSTKAWATRLSGRSCAGPAQFSAAWYLPGDYSLPHNDIAESGESFDRQVVNRQVAYVWHLAKDWRSEWGGALYWCARAWYLAPVFNTLVLFNVGTESNHFVTHVSPYAQGKRLAINGWWTGPAATGGAVWKGPGRIRTGSSTEIEIY
jgi:hypothetical protein